MKQEGGQKIKKTPITESSIAVIETGGKQYLVAEGDILCIEKVPPRSRVKGKKIIFDKVLFSTLGAVQVGTPYLEKAKVEGEILEDGRAKKVRVLKYKPKTRQRTVYGHRQPYTRIRITKIS